MGNGEPKVNERVEEIRRDASLLAVTCDHTWGEVRGKGACAECITRLVTADLARVRAAGQKFVDHYPNGINPYLDEAYNEMRAALEGR